MKIDILTLFPGMFDNVFGQSMLKIAQKKGLASMRVHDLRRWTHDRHRTADDKPFGGGPGMVMKVEPVFEALAELRKDAGTGGRATVILMTPQGKKFDQPMAKEISALGHIIVICGHYEGVDERIRSMVDQEVSIGDYVLTCGELPAMVFCDAVVRLIPGVLGEEGCLEEESFENGLLEYPQYTRPAAFMDMEVPEVLLCGDPKKIDRWRHEQAVKRTTERRPDLMKGKCVNKESI